INESFRIICGYSIHSHTEHIRQGFITIKGGHRAGICGTAVVSDGKITALRDISTINMRIARQIPDIANEILYAIFSNKISGTLIAGPPASGKTTILRALIYSLASYKFGYKKVAVIDSRGELAAVFKGCAQTGIGATSDIFDGYPKGAGVSAAVRVMAPDIIIADEIGDKQESDAIADGLNSGVVFIAAAHAKNMRDLSRRAHIQKLIDLGAFEYIVFLKDRETPGEVKEILPVKIFQNEKEQGICLNISD
ncbi:MAG: Flp pilus assembly complex ATPase component TadA, partial [Oscillospiraceae bacterium]|nr:Flp pilus assembly complex ATPase component TadA [Oscillospiraceae bacterium]